MACCLTVVTVISSLEGDVTLTGLGRFVDARSGSFDAPLDANARYDDVGYDDEEYSETFGVGTQFENGLYGFVFHDSCWSVLERAFNPDPVPLDRLYEVCLSMPTPLATRCVNWGHNYGGLYYWLRSPYHPWDVIEEPVLYDMSELGDPEPGDSVESRTWVDRFGLPSPRKDDEEWTEPTVRGPTIMSDPYHTGEILAIRSERPPPLPTRSVAYSLSNTAIDPFSRLPYELRAGIAQYLPTSDFLRGRLALRGLWDIFDSQQFWATRFLGRGAERSWLFESQLWDESGQDWRFLCRQTSDTRKKLLDPTSILFKIR